jgi:hypothetical protein
MCLFPFNFSSSDYLKNEWIGSRGKAEAGSGIQFPLGIIQKNICNVNGVFDGDTPVNFEHADLTLVRGFFGYDVITGSHLYFYTVNAIQSNRLAEQS